VLVQLFSAKNVDGFLESGSWANGQHEPYSPQELRAIHKEIDRIYAMVTKGKKPSDHPKFELIIGAPGAGKATFARGFEKTHAVIDPNLIRENFSLFKAALEEKQASGKSAKEAEDYAYSKYRNATLFISRSVLGRLFEQKYDVAYVSQPKPFVQNETLVNNIRAGGYALRANFFHSPLEQLEFAAENRANETGRQMREGYLDTQYDAMPGALMKAMGMGIDCHIYWRDHARGAPVLAAKTNGRGGIEMRDELAMRHFSEELASSTTVTVAMLQHEYRRSLQGVDEKTEAFYKAVYD
jgi:Zeta toxin